HRAAESILQQQQDIKRAARLPVQAAGANGAGDIGRLPCGTAAAIAATQPLTTFRLEHRPKPAYRSNPSLNTGSSNTIYPLNTKASIAAVNVCCKAGSAFSCIQARGFSPGITAATGTPFR